MVFDIPRASGIEPATARLYPAVDGWFQASAAQTIARTDGGLRISVAASDSSPQGAFSGVISDGRRAYSIQTKLAAAVPSATEELPRVAQSPPAAQPSGFKPGTGPVTLKLPDLPSVGPAICYEIVFPSAVAAKLSRPTFLFNPSNDAWFGSWGPPQHLAHARMRSIEEGLPTVRATTSGISAMIGPDGRILEQIPDRRRGYIDLLMPKAYPPTLFSRAGNFIPLVLAIMLALSLYLRGWVAIPTRGRCFLSFALERVLGLGAREGS